jgi:hypothetical protein
MPDNTDYMLTTMDNPWNPYTNYDEWFAFDRAQGYDTPGYLARIVNSSNDLSEADQEQAISDAIDEIVSLNVLGIYMKIFPDTIIKV